MLATKDIISKSRQAYCKYVSYVALVIVFMFVLWAYSLYLTYRAWYKILYSDGEEGSNMWR